MSDGKSVMAPPVVGTLPAAPGDLPGGTLAQDQARSTALRIHQEKSLPFLENLIGDKDKNDRIRLDAIKLVQQQALPPPQPTLGDIEITIVVDL